MNSHRDRLSRNWPFLAFAVALLALAPHVTARDQKPEPVDVEGQPLAANVTRLLQALDILGTPLSEKETSALQEAARDRNAKKLQELLDPHALVVVSINP